jgi:transaldolase/glucose-6-phosphate isomerase
MTQNPLLKAADLGQSIWLDFLRRHLITAGELDQLITEDGLRGVTSNPKIFEKAIGGSDDYDERIRVLAHEGKTAEDIYQDLTVNDVQSAADHFRSIYDESDGRHGFVSLEVSPHLAGDTDGTIAEARKLWRALDRPNVLIKVPATREGLPAIRQLISEGVNVNVTLLFGLPRYREVADAYLSGLEDRVKAEQPIDRVASVASFFLSRIDVLVDPQIDDKRRAGADAAAIAESLRGQVAIACARLAYQIYKEIYAEDRFRALADKDGRTQRLLWASTSTKDPTYSDVKYVDALIGPDTINTAPRETLDAYRDHGDPAPRLEQDLDGARQVLAQLANLDIDIDEVTQQLEDEGIEKFSKPYDRLMQTLKEERRAALDGRPDRQVLELGDHQAVVNRRLSSFSEIDFCRRLWRKDATLWKRDAENRRTIRNGLGWLHVAETMESNLPGLMKFVREVRDAGIRHVVHMGMGGSSLAPLTFQRTFRESSGGLPLTVLDTTDPETILKVEERVPLEHTLFIVASKSGTTAETRALGDYFFENVRRNKGDEAGENFAAITDAGTPLAGLAEERSFRRCFVNMSDIGGRYSALSYFGLLPAALLGVNVEEILARALLMAHACSSCVPIERNPGVALGAALGELAGRGHDKITFLMPEGITTLGMWLEQLLAESTGKEGTGLIPISDEPAGAPESYDRDRLFVHFRIETEMAPEMERMVFALHKAGHPVITIALNDRLDIGQEFLRWEIATATAGALLGINAFDQPNVQESKDNTARLLKIVEEKGELPQEEAALREGALRLYTDSPRQDVRNTIERFLSQAGEGDYVALMAYVTEQPATQERLQHLRTVLRDGLHRATTLGYGPRFLHSTGQLHKGGPNTGLFLQLTATNGRDAPIPDRAYTFGTMKRSQALGDFQALRKHGRRLLRVDLGPDVDIGLDELARAVEAVLSAPAAAAAR